MRVSSYGLGLLVVAAWPSTVRADKPLDDLRVMYEKEAIGCKRSSDGMAMVTEGTTELAKAAGPDQADLARDAEKLQSGLAIMRGYCGELTSALEFLRANPTTKYKKVEREMDERDNKIRRGRAASKKVIAELEPISRRMIPKINAARVAAPQPAPDKRTPVKFPSGRGVELPVLAGTWKVNGSTATDIAEYSDKTITAIVSTRPFAHATCEQQRRLVGGSDAEAVSELERSGTAKQLGVAWLVGFTRKGHAVQIGCTPRGDGGILATTDVAPADQTTLMTELASLTLRMVATQLDATPVEKPAPAPPKS